MNTSNMSITRDVGHLTVLQFIRVKAAAVCINRISMTFVSTLCRRTFRLTDEVSNIGRSHFCTYSHRAGGDNGDDDVMVINCRPSMHL